jgi:FMN phosphatase YigB (HAD superfamily)
MSLARLRSVAQESFDVLSLDVFDTLLLRDASSQRERFAEVAVVLAGLLRERACEVDARTLFALRRRTHALAYEAVSLERPDGDATLARMSEIQASLLGLDPSIMELFIAAELDIESRHLTPNHKLIRLVEELRRDGKRVIAVSDMYLSAVEIGQLMTRVTGGIPVQRIYTSCEFGVTKRSSRLFAAVAAAEAVPPERLLHYGDDECADWTMARAARCQAFLFRRPNWMLAARKLAALRFALYGAHRL